MPLPDPIYATKDFSQPLPCSAPVFYRPFPGVNIDYVLKQEFMRYWNDRNPLALNTPHSEFEDFLLVEESDPNLDGGMERWTRTYAKVPSTWSVPTAFNYNFIGFGATQDALTGDSIVPARHRYQLTVPAKIVYDYFLIDGTTYSDFLDIPVIEGLKYYGNHADAVTKKLFSDWIEYDSIAIPGTTPSRETYEDWIANGDLIVAEDSQLTQWLGNIIQRQTIYIRPQ